MLKELSLDFIKVKYMIIVVTLFVSCLITNMSFAKILHGTFNQSNPEFGESAGKQCTCCCLYAIAFSKIIRTPGNLNTYDLDLIVRQGDLLYKS